MAGNTDFSFKFIDRKCPEILSDRTKITRFKTWSEKLRQVHYRNPPGVFASNSGLQII